MGDSTEPQLVELSRQKCHSLLATHQVGRLGVNADRYPLILVVDCGLDRDVIVIRTHPSTTLSNPAHANVTFEVDVTDQDTRSGWSVLVRGLAEEVSAAHRDELIARTYAAEVNPLAPGEFGHRLRLIPHQVTGRRIIPGELPPPFPTPPTCNARNRPGPMRTAALP